MPQPVTPLARVIDAITVDRAAQVVGGLRGVHPGLEALFDDAHAQRPAGPQAAAG